MGPQYRLLCSDNNVDDTFHREDDGARDAGRGNGGGAGGGFTAGGNSGLVGLGMVLMAVGDVVVTVVIMVV